MSIQYIENRDFSSENAEPATDVATRYAKKQALFEEASKATGVAIPELHQIAYGFWQAARSYARAGRPVFPVYADKSPATWHGHLDATTDLKQIDEWWSAMPLARVAMRTGEVSGIMVVDVDMHGEVDGRETLKALGLEVPKDWPIQLTPTGNGFHIPVEAMPGISSGKLGSGIDLKANGGYVVVAPSMRSFAKPGYRVANPDIPTPFYIPGKPHSKVKLPPLPDNWRAAIMATKKAEKKDRPLAPLMAADETSSYGRAALRDACRSIASAEEGERNKTLFRESCGIYELVAGGEITDEDAEVEMSYAAEECGLHEDEIDRTLRNGKDRGFKAPRARPVFDGGGWYEQPDKPGAKSSTTTGSALSADTSKADPNWRARLAVDGGNKPQPLSVLKNAIIAFRHAPEWNGVLARDLFRHKTMMMRPAPFMKGNHERFAPREWTDIDDTMTTEWLQDQRIYVKQTVTMPAIEAVASENGFDPLEDYVFKLNWDGVPRLRKWLPTYLGCEDTPYVQAVGEKFAVAAIARAIRPGCKADAMLILEGEQGKRKSTAIKVLGGEFYCDAMTDIGGKDGAMLAAGFWIHELPELDAFNRSETTKIKADLSRTEDVYRPPYGRRIVRAPRRCVFIGSTNQTAYLKDETGGRRFWPVACGEIDIDALKRDRDQLWAEALALFQSGATWWLDTPELVEAASRAQSARYSEDPWDEAISRYLQEHEDVSVAEVLSGACHIPTARHDQSNKNRVAKSLRSLGYVRFQQRTDHGRVWRYRAALAPVEDSRPVTNPAQTSDRSAPAGR